MSMTEEEVRTGPRTMGELHEADQALRPALRGRPRSNAARLLRLRSQAEQHRGTLKRALKEEAKAAKRAKSPWLRLLPKDRKRAKAEHAHAKALRESSEKALAAVEQRLQAAEAQQEKHRQWKQAHRGETTQHKALKSEGLQRQRHLGAKEAERLKAEAPEDPVKRALWERDLGRKAAKEEWGLMPGQDVLRVRAERRKIAQEKQAQRQTRTADRTVHPRFTRSR